MSPPKAVVFDVGGVLCPNPVVEFAKVDTEHGLPPGTVQAYFRGGRGFQLCEIGLMAVEDLYAQVARDIRLSHGAKVTAERLDLMLRACMGDAVRAEMRDMLRRLRSAGYRLALLTNIFAERCDWLRREFPPDLIDVYAASSELGLRKPDRRIYLRVLEMLECDPAEVVFIDDFIENIEPAKSLGIHTILFDDVAQVGRALRALGIEAAECGSIPMR